MREREALSRAAGEEEKRNLAAGIQAAKATLVAKKGNQLQDHVRCSRLRPLLLLFTCRFAGHEN